MQPRAPAPSTGDEDPLDKETHARVLDHQSNGMIQGITEIGLHLVKLRIPVQGTPHAPGTRICIRESTDDSEESATLLGTTRHRDLSSMAQSELMEVVKTILVDLADPCLAFYNRAGNLTLKMHAFQLLPGIGNSKARSMVEARGRVGWDKIEALDEACQVDSAGLLAERLCQEIVDRHMTPSLLDLLIRA
ncbi:MAG: DUF655 domain-containing protein [Candidatus Thalassarchaeaceae archaeon]|jgi:putative nucleotide binding protein|nr:DUF655 domain-containing protein [Candidatus Thalassarchaeaceae archaeon]